MVLAIWGGMALRRLWFPLALLMFMVPLPDVTISNLNFRLKMMAADLGVRIVESLGVIAARSGNQVYLEGDKVLVIANVCNGLRTLISLFAFGAVYAYVCKLRGPWRLFLFAMTLPVAVLSNSLRIVSLIIVADVWDIPTAVGWYHDFSGILIFVLAFLLMFALEKAILALRKALGRPAKIVPLFDGQLRGPEDEDQWSRIVAAAARPVVLTAAVILALAAAGTWWLNMNVPSVWNQQMARRALPREMTVGGRTWPSQDMELDEQTMTILETRDYLLRRFYIPGSVPVDFALVFSQDNRKGTHPPDLCLEGTGQDIVAIRDVLLEGVEGRPALPCRELIVQSGKERTYYLYTYKCGSVYTRSFWRQQLVIFLNSLLHRNATGALVRVSAPMSDRSDEGQEQVKQLLRLAIPHLDKNLP
jgi:EpsI family protein